MKDDGRLTQLEEECIRWRFRNAFLTFRKKEPKPKRGENQIKFRVNSMANETLPIRHIINQSSKINNRASDDIELFIERFNGATYTSIGKKLGVTTGHARQRSLRGRRILMGARN